MKKNSRPFKQPELYWVEEITRLMDAKFRFPGTNFRFGLDPLLGLFPVVGDLTSFAISGGLILYMMRFGASRKVVILMVLNILLDATIGSIPIIGQVFDFYYKANTRNVRLLQKHYKEGKYQGSGTGIIIGVALLLVVLIFLMLWGLWKLIDWLLAWWQ